MDNLIQVDVKGIEELQLQLLDLSKRVAKNALRAGVYAGAKVLADEAKLRAPVYTGPVSHGHPPPGTLKRAIITKQIPEKSNEFNQTFYVTVRKGKKYRNQGKKGNLSQDAYYANWVEYGYHHVPRNPNVTVSARGIKHITNSRQHRAANRSVWVAPHPFMRPAFDAKAGEAAEAIKTRLAQRIAQEFSK